MTKVFLSLLIAISVAQTISGQKEWTLDDCLRHARESNLSLQRLRLSEQTAAEDLHSAKGALLPSLSFSMTQSVSVRPFQEVGTAMVNGGMATTTSSETTQSGTYGLNANWTLWDGGRQHLRVKQEQMNAELSSLATSSQLSSIEEQLTRLYVQIQYQSEAVGVCRKILQTAEQQLERGRSMSEAGRLSRADLSQLEAQVATSRYDLVNAQSQVEQSKRQLRELLQLGIGEPFEVCTTLLPDTKAEAIIPRKEDVYEMAIATRPEIATASKSIDLGRLQLQSAKSGYWPTISLQAGAGTSHYTGARTAWGEQMKTNLNASAGINISVPIFDNRNNRTAVNKARINLTTAQIDLADKRQSLSSTIEDLWLQATTAQQRFYSARASLVGQQSAQELLQEQFECGRATAVELMQGRDRVLQATQSLLEAKYTTILAVALLHYYAGEGIIL